jgi:hypothetical protein
MIFEKGSQAAFFLLFFLKEKKEKYRSESRLWQQKRIKQKN